MRSLILVSLALSMIASSTHASAQTSNATRMVDVGGHDMRVHVRGLDGRRPGSPVLVFEAGATNSLEVWNAVLAALPDDLPAIAYDRAGLGHSEWDDTPPTPRHVSTRLRALLEAIGAEPPYVLVGYSWGGSLARWFAGYYPDEIAGLVFVDPGPIVTMTHAERLAPYDSIGAGKAGYDAFWSAFGAFFAGAAPAVRAEFDVFRGLMEIDPAQRDLRPLPRVPTAVLVAGKHTPFPESVRLPFDARAHFEVDARHRVRMLQRWIEGSPRGMLVVSNHVSHAIPREDPGLIIWAIDRVLDRR